MKANEVKEMLNDRDIFSLLVDLGGDPIDSGTIVSRTCCHNPAHEGKHKLVYYSDSKTFRCFTNCGSMDVFGLVGRILELDFYNSFKYVCEKFGISYQSASGVPESEKIEVEHFQKFKKRIEKIKLKIVPKMVLNTFYNLYHRLWIDEGISSRTMKLFNIKFSISQNQIIIPHYDIDGNLIGVRARNLDPELIEDGKKYMPIYHKGEVLKHPTGANLYGLNVNKEAIQKYGTVILVESEKSVLQINTMFPDMSIGVCISGSSFTNYQLEILKDLGIEEVIIALDKEYEEVGSQEEKFYIEKVNNVFLNKLSPYFRTSILWDIDGLLDLKDSPTDKGIEVFQTLMNKRIYPKN